MVQQRGIVEEAVVQWEFFHFQPRKEGCKLLLEPVHNGRSASVESEGTDEV